MLNMLRRSLIFEEGGRKKLACSGTACGRGWRRTGRLAGRAPHGPFHESEGGGEGFSSISLKTVWS